MRKGKVTIPTDASFVEGTKRIADLWGADAVWDSEGATMPENAGELAEKVYATYFVIRGDNEWGNAHLREAHRTFLLSERVTATSTETEIDVMKGYFAEEVCPDEEELRRWEVCNRTTGRFTDKWSYDAKRKVVSVHDAEPYCEYTVSFLAKVLWHPVQMFNYLTNDWTREKERTYDPAYFATHEYIKRFCHEWCQSHPEVNVVRFTTLLYQFTLIFNEQKKEKYVDWFGYSMACSPALLDAFEREKGYALRAEDLIDGGCYNNAFRVPNRKYLDYMDFLGRRVADTVRELTDIIHSYGKEAAMFFGDEWIGCEPFGKYFKTMNLDGVVGSVGSGVTVRMLAEISDVKFREARFLPYFFPDVFFEGNEDNAVAEINKNWAAARRALLRTPLDRMGFGGYLALADTFPKFVDRVTEICEEFRVITDTVQKAKPHTHATVALLHRWGRLRSWQSHMVAHELWYQQIYSYQGVLEALAGLPVEVKFIDFDDVKRGIEKDIDVIVNVGARDTAYSGGDAWNDPAVVTALRRWVAEGHGFVGIGEPSAYQKDGRLFALSDVLGVDEELGFTMSEDKYNISAVPHFITEDVVGAVDYGEGTKNIYALPKTSVLDIAVSDRCKRDVNVGEVQLAANDFGKGHGVYISGLPYSPQNARLLLRALLWSCNKQEALRRAFSSNVDTECSYYPSLSRYALINNTTQTQETEFFDMEGKKRALTLRPNEILWTE